MFQGEVVCRSGASLRRRRGRQAVFREQFLAHLGLNWGPAPSPNCLNSFVFAVVLCQVAHFSHSVGLFYSFACVFARAHKPEQVTRKLCHTPSNGNAVTDHARQRFAVEQPDHSMKMIPLQVRHRLFAKNVSAKNGGVPCG